LQYGFIAKQKTQPFHASNEPSLTMTHPGKLPGKMLLAPGQFWPIFPIMNKVHISPHSWWILCQ
jgi:hypothetical protein